METPTITQRLRRELVSRLFSFWGRVFVRGLRHGCSAGALSTVPATIAAYFLREALFAS
ncbi:hypothetical protein HNE_1681 [Hyphomonas neptunium ATCC 15444]|uniref:Uncharacterized protein n=1 Tax=Hyphomonas neptunium (strain ATCC 15444) TaxID=228405 RepID=Q0C1K5_HYPNA|nr:hypothetical protein HNE_1681 [Hyphomonas neptunium ATCC 15444]